MSQKELKRLYKKAERRNKRAYAKGWNVSTRGLV